MVRSSYAPVLGAVLALNHREPSKAIDLLQGATNYELGYQGANSVGFAGSLYPIYVRGEPYLNARQGFEAAAEFQKILKHRGIVSSGRMPIPIFPCSSKPSRSTPGWNEPVGSELRRKLSQSLDRLCPFLALCVHPCLGFPTA